MLQKTYYRLNKNEKVQIQNHKHDCCINRSTKNVKTYIYSNDFRNVFSLDKLFVETVLEWRSILEKLLGISLLSIIIWNLFKDTLDSTINNKMWNSINVSSSWVIFKNKQETKKGVLFPCVRKCFFIVAVCFFITLTLDIYITLYVRLMFLYACTMYEYIEYKINLISIIRCHHYYNYLKLYKYIIKCYLMQKYQVNVIIVRTLYVFWST